MTEETNAGGTGQAAAALLGGEAAPTAPAGGPVDTTADSAPAPFEGGEHPAPFEGGEHPATFEGGDYPSPFEGDSDPLAPGRPEDFEIPRFVGENEELTDSHAEFDRWHRNMLATAELPASIGSALVEEIGKTSNAYQRMSDAEQQIWEHEQEAQLRNVFGDAYEQKIDLARQLVAEIEKKSPGVAAYLDATGAGSSAFVVGMLATHAERLAERKQTKRAG